MSSRVVGSDISSLPALRTCLRRHACFVAVFRRICVAARWRLDGQDGFGVWAPLLLSRYICLTFYLYHAAACRARVAWARGALILYALPAAAGPQFARNIYLYSTKTPSSLLPARALVSCRFVAAKRRRHCDMARVSPDVCVLTGKTTGRGALRWGGKTDAYARAGRRARRLPCRAPGS